MNVTAIIEQDGNCFIAYCPEIPGANGQGRTIRTIEECRESLGEAINLILSDRQSPNWASSSSAKTYRDT